MSYEELPIYTQKELADYMLNVLIPADIPVIIHGSPGTGKSAIVAQVTECMDNEVMGLRGVHLMREGDIERKPKLWDFRLTERDAVDVRGAIVADTNTETTKSFRPHELPNEGEHGIMFLDEISSAHPQVQTVAYKILNDRMLGDYTIPEGVYVCGATNLDSDKAVVHKMPTAARNRAVHVKLLPHVESWLEWACRNNIEQEVIAFIRATSANGSDNVLYGFDPKKDEYAFATFRTWEFVSRLLQQFKRRPSSTEMRAYQSAIGHHAYEFTSFLELLRSDPPNPELAVTDPENAPTSFKNPSLGYFYVSAVAKLATHRNLENFTKYFELLKGEGMVTYGKLMFSEAMRVNPELKESTVYSEFMLEHKEVFID